MGTLIMAGQLILALAILVSLHEWGHYIASRAFGIRVEKFFIFFDAWGVKLFSKKINDTEWGIGWLPLGGYVKISGMIDESLDKDQLESEPEDHEFRSKPAWQRLIVMIGGVTVNFFLGILIFALSLWYYGDTWIPTSVANENGIIPTELGIDAGFQEGDKLLKINGNEVEKFRDFSNPDLFVSEGEPLTYDVENNGEARTIVLADSFKSMFLESKGVGLYRTRAKVIVSKPRKKAKESGFQKADNIIAINDVSTPYFNNMTKELQANKGKEVVVSVLRGGDTVKLTHTLDTSGAIGVELDAKAEFKDRLITTKYGFAESFPEGTKRGMNTLMLNIKAFGQMFSGKLDPVKTVSGPFQIATIYGPTWDWHKFWQITGMLSFVLAFMNLLPIPALDGGHVLFLLIEIVRGKPLPEKVMYYFQIVGMIILFALMAFILFVDGINTFFN
jgi:regulator of sigma E protease